MLRRNKALRFPLYRRFLLMRFAIILGLNMQGTIMSYFVYQLTYNPVTKKGDALVLGLMGLWEVIPAIGCSLFSGHFVDISEKKKMAFWFIIGYFLLCLYFTLLATPSLPGVMSKQYIIWLIYAGIFIGGALRAFLSPASFALLGLLVPKRIYPNATTWSSIAWQTGFVLGPLLAGAIIVIGGFQMSLVATAIVETVAIVAVWFIPTQPIMKKEREAVLKSLGEGLRFVFNSQLILAVLTLDMFAVLFGGAVALLPLYANEILQTGEVGFGWMRAAPGIGSIFTLVLLSVFPLKKNPGKNLLLSIAAYGIVTIIFGLCGEIASTRITGTFLGCNVSAAFLLAITMLFLTGVFDSVSVVIRSTVLQLYTPDQMRGRVAAVNTMFISSSNEFGAMESGITARWMGAVPAVVFGGSMTLAIVGITYFAAPLLRVFKLEPPARDKIK